GLFEVAGGPVGNLAEDQFLRHRAAESHLDLAIQLAFGHEIAVVFRPAEHVAQGADAAGNNRHFVYGMRVGQSAGDEGMAGFVVGHTLFLVGIHDATLALQADGPALDAFLKVGHRYAVLVFAGRQKRGFVDQVGQVGPDRARGQAGDVAQIDIVPELDVADMDLEDGLAADDVRPIHHHRTVEAAGAKKGDVKRLRPVGGGHDNDAAIGVEAVHLDQELVEGLLALVVAADDTAAAGFTKGVELVDENDARRPIF